MSILVFIDAAVQSRLLEQERRRTVVEDAKNGGDEFCISCFKVLGYPALSTHIEASVRKENGAYYTEGVGQTCAGCAEKEKT